MPDVLYIQALTSFPEFLGAPVVDLLEERLFAKPRLIYKLVPVTLAPGEVTRGFGKLVEYIPSLNCLNKLF